MSDGIIRTDWDIAVASEVQRAQSKFGSQTDFTDGDWLAVLTEEVGEAATEALRAHHFDPEGLLRRSNETGTPIEDTDYPLVRLRRELVQVAAVACRWVVAIDARAIDHTEDESQPDRNKWLQGEAYLHTEDESHG